MASGSFIDRVMALELPLDHFIVIGSGVMDTLGLRPSDDIDLVVSDELYVTLAAEGWKEEERHGEKMLLKDDVEAWLTWGIPEETLTFTELAKHCVIIDGIFFSSPEYVIKVKKHTARPKDIEDVKMLEGYIKSNE